jgi:hypothetical protein
MSNTNETKQKSTANANTLLTRKDAIELGGALARWHELRNTAIKTPTSDAELKGLTEHIAQTLIQHADEFVGCWFTIRDEYEPVLNLLARVTQRVSHINAQQYAAFAAQAKADAQADNKIVSLNAKEDK